MLLNNLKTDYFINIMFDNLFKTVLIYLIILSFTSFTILQGEVYFFVNFQISYLVFFVLFTILFTLKLVWTIFLHSLIKLDKTTHYMITD